MQLQQARSIGLRDNVAAPAHPSGAMAVSAQQADQAAGVGFTLQISLFDTQAAAQVIAQQLDGAGAAVRIRQVRTTDAKQLFRVEVGDFASSESALAFQRRFERNTGYSGVLIAL
jgi:cell division septation protein DedD